MTALGKHKSENLGDYEYYFNLSYPYQNES